MVYKRYGAIRKIARGRESDRLFMDIAKYVVTVGVIGGVMSDRMTFQIAIALILVAIGSFFIGWKLIPKEDK